MRRLLCISIGLLIVSLDSAFGQGTTFVGLGTSPTAAHTGSARSDRHTVGVPGGEGFI